MPSLRNEVGLPGAALRDDVAGGIPNRQSGENLTVVFADHAWDLAGLRKRASTPRGLQQ